MDNASIFHVAGDGGIVPTVSIATSSCPPNLSSVGNIIEAFCFPILDTRLLRGGGGGRSKNFRLFAEPPGPIQKLCKVTSRSPAYGIKLTRAYPSDGPLPQLQEICLWCLPKVRQRRHHAIHSLWVSSLRHAGIEAYCSLLLPTRYQFIFFDSFVSCWQICRVLWNEKRIDLLRHPYVCSKYIFIFL